MKLRRQLIRDGRLQDTLLTNPTVLYDNCIRDPISHLLTLQWGQCPSRGLLRDCEIFGNLRITFVWSSTIYTSSCSWSWRHSAASPPAINDTNQWYLGEILGPRSEILEILGPRSPGSCYNCYIELPAAASPGLVSNVTLCLTEENILCTLLLPPNIPI